MELQFKQTPVIPRKCLLNSVNLSVMLQYFSPSLPSIGLQWSYLSCSNEMLLWALSLHIAFKWGIGVPTVAGQWENKSRANCHLQFMWGQHAGITNWHDQDTGVCEVHNGLVSLQELEVVWHNFYHFSFASVLNLGPNRPVDVFHYSLSSHFT